MVQNRIHAVLHDRAGWFRLGSSRRTRYSTLSLNNPKLLHHSGSFMTIREQPPQISIKNAHLLTPEQTQSRPNLSKRHRDQELRVGLVLAEPALEQLHCFDHIHVRE